MTKQALQEELKSRVKSGIKPSHLKKARSESDIALVAQEQAIQQTQQQIYQALITCQEQLNDKDKQIKQAQETIKNLTAELNQTNTTITELTVKLDQSLTK